MFDWLKFWKKNPPPESSNDDMLVSINYFISKSNGPMIDIEIKDYSDDSIDALLSMLDILMGDDFYMETLKMVTSGFVADGREDIVELIQTHLEGILASKLITAQKELLEEPCIKPSDMML